MFWTVLIAFAVVYLTQTFLALRQSKNFAATFTSLRRRGRVALGKKQGLLSAGALVLFLLDDDGRIVEGHKLSGVTVLSRFRVFDAFGNEIFSEEIGPVSGSVTVTHPYAGPAFEPGMFYQFRATSFREKLGDRTAISSTEDLTGVFQYIAPP